MSTQTECSFPEPGAIILALAVDRDFTISKRAERQLGMICEEEDEVVWGRGLNGRGARSVRKRMGLGGSMAG